MSASVHIEPSGDRRAAFARWVLDRDPNFRTASATGWDVPVDWYPDVPVALLEGAYVDGFAYDRPAPQPVKPVGVVLTAAQAPVAPESQDAAVKPQTAPRKPRKRAPRKNAQSAPRKSVQSAPSPAKVDG